MQCPDWNTVEWRTLEKGEIIKDGDWVDVSPDGWRDDPQWSLTSCGGQLVPDPKFSAHRKYRRVMKS